MKLRVKFLLILVGVLVACSGGDDSGGLLGLNSGPTPIVDQEAGIQTAETYLSAWAEQDYGTMYGLISPNARDAYRDDEFISIYENLWNSLRLDSLEWERGTVLTQGTTVIMEYSMTFTSRTLGTFTDSERQIRIIPSTSDGGMRVAWSRMDIFDGWSSGARLAQETFLPSRGNIYDRDGNSMADQNGVALGLYITKQNVPNQGGCIELAVSLFGREYNDIQAVFDRNNPDTRFFLGDIDQETFQIRQAEINALCNPEIFDRSTRRYFASAAPHVVGYVGFIPSEQQEDYAAQGYPADALVGLDGIESAWEDELRGTIGNRLTLRSVTDDVITVITEKPAEPGQSVYLTIDRELQQGLQVALADAYSSSQPTWGRTSPGAAVVVMDVNTGAILAMVSYPSFDPSAFSPFSPYLDAASIIQGYYSDLQRPLLNRATQGTYPLGSVFKLVSSVGAADSGIFPLDRLNTCTGSWDGTPYGDIVRTDWYLPGHGTLDGRGAIINSCNPYYWAMGVAFQNTDPFLLPNYARMMGFGDTTGLRGVTQNPGQVPDPDWSLETQGLIWGYSQTLNQVIGQGELLVSPLQVARMVALIANDGNLMTPYLVDEVRLLGQEPSFIHEVEFEALDLDPTVLAEVRQAMCSVTLFGTANFIFGPWYEFQGPNAPVVCGKTGTAQSGATSEPHAWFGAFAPAENPEIAIAVIVENSCEGSEVAAPIARRAVELYYGLPQIEWPALWQSGCTEIVLE